MPRAFDRDELLAAFDDIAEAAVAAGTRLDIAVFGGFGVTSGQQFPFHN
jgi:hypothetical protein